MFLSAGTYYCQSIQSTTASATANLILPISISSWEGGLDFGDIILTGNSFESRIDPSNGELFIVTGHPNRNFTINFSPSALDNNVWVSNYGGMSGSLQFDPIVVDANYTPVNNGDTFTLIDWVSSGIYYLRVGGIINIDAQQPHGDYKGIFTITVSY